MSYSEVFDKQNIDYLYTQLYNDKEELQVLPFEFYSNIDPIHIRQFCLENGIYCLPTTELIDYLKSMIKDKSTIEIGAGHGTIGRLLNIPSTDSFLQEKPEMKAIYDKIKQPTAKYGKNVEKLEAEEALRKYKPAMVIAAWVTHKYEPKKHFNEGNMFGIREHKILEKANYIFIGNESTHRRKIILDIPHDTIYPDWLVSRVFKKDPSKKEMICIWNKE